MTEVYSIITRAQLVGARIGGLESELYVRELQIYIDLGCTGVNVEQGRPSVSTFSSTSIGSVGNVELGGAKPLVLFLLA